jgi:hypothetical protein
MQPTPYRLGMLCAAQRLQAIAEAILQTFRCGRRGLTQPASR